MLHSHKRKSCRLGCEFNEKERKFVLIGKKYILVPAVPIQENCQKIKEWSFNGWLIMIMNIQIRKKKEWH